jgi:hypothetical protein
VGTVRNGTSGQPAAGDEVILLSVNRSPHEEARTRVDSQGAFTLEIQDPGRPHLVRVMHEGVNYDKQVSAGGEISLEVFDAAAHARGIRGGIEIIRAGVIRADTRGNSLHVCDMIEIRNQSDPPVTEAGERTFEVYLPGEATLNSVLAAGPENIPASISAAPVRGQPGHYSVGFPLRPGSTKFAFNYDLPYAGHARFRIKEMYPLEQLAVMLPPPMQFTAQSRAFQVLPLGNDRYRVEAAEQVAAGSELEFEISGVGALPEIPARNQVPAPPFAGAGVNPEPGKSDRSEASRFAATTASAGAAQRSSAHASLLAWWIPGVAVVLLLIACVIHFLRGLHGKNDGAASAARRQRLVPQTSATLVSALKDGLFLLESDRLEGAIHGDDYASAKRALEGTIRWAVSRGQGAKKGVP